MGIFSRNQPEPEPEPRRDKVAGLLGLYMRESDADPDGNGSASRELAKFARSCTQAEYAAALRAAKRHGY